VSGEELHEILKEIDTNMNGQIELDEYLQVAPFSLSLSFPFFIFSIKSCILVV